MNFDRYKDAIHEIALGTKQVLLVQGAPGIGMVTFAREALDECGGDYMEVRCGQLDHSDFTFMPLLKGESELGYAMPPFVHTLNDALKHNKIVILDEANYIFDFNERARFIMDFALMGLRMICTSPTNMALRSAKVETVNINLEVTTDDWIRWAIGADIHPHVISFVSAFGTKGATFMAWSNASKLLKGNTFNDSVLRIMMAGILGGPADEFVEFCRIADKMPSTEEILAGATSDDVAIQYAIDQVRKHLQQDK